MGKGIPNAPMINIDNHPLDVIHEFTYLGCKITDDLLIENELSRRIDLVATNFVKLSQKV